MKKLDNVDALYSLLDVNNQQLDIIAQDNTFTNTLNFVSTTLTNEIFSLNDTVIDRFCINILPRIHHNVKSLILDSLSMERILRVADYPNLTKLKLFNFSLNITRYYFTDRSLIGKMLQRQITDLILVFGTECKAISIKLYRMDVYGYLLTFFDNLKHFSNIGSYSYDFPPLQLSKSPFSPFFSSTLQKLCIRVMTYDDCLVLLDGRLKQLTTLIVDIINMTSCSSNIYNMVSLHFIN
ncbi:unnamed protein product [Rotaria sp. Silwood2]|nr:unnamed protein product [Rotaria sp. Silwood2]CAF4638411.1 unnamed protein product [Rotaria sp. Silwood2]CAF4665588.1 unnamed protein product [Rotaria sp. Silwood2]